MTGRPLLHVVHCVDTEGPLEEPLEATFARLRDEKGLDLPPSLATLGALQSGAVSLDGREAEIAAFLAPARLAYLSTWAEVEAMVAAVADPAFRAAHADPAGNPYAFSWFVIDVVGYRDNPRRKATGWHAVWDQYRRLLAGRSAPDAIGWHFHTVPIGGHALEYNACWTNTAWHEQALARRLLERESFPALWRAGGVIQRNDQSHWLDRFIPFDYSNWAQRNAPCGGPGELSDWRGAPLDWAGYHPHRDDYRRPGEMRRTVFRCLDVDTPACRLTRDDVREAFARVRDGRTAVLAFTNHDRRDLRPDIARAEALVREVSAEFPEVPWRWSNARDAARDSLGVADAPAPQFALAWERGVLRISADRELFGPEPFFAVAEEGDRVYRDELTIEGERQWAWRPTRPRLLRAVAVGAANAAGRTGVARMAVSERDLQ